MEMSFVDENGVMGLVEELLSSTLTKTAPELDVTTTPFPRLTYTEAMEKVVVSNYYDRCGASQCNL